MLRLTFLILLVYSTNAAAQEIVVRDSCSDNATYFYKRNDSVYHVINKYRDIVLFEGNLIKPPFICLNIHRDNPSFYPKSLVRYTDTCKFFNLVGQLFYINIIKTTSTEQLDYKNNKLCRQTIVNNEKTIVKSFNEQGELIYYKNNAVKKGKRIQITKQIVNGKLVTTEEVYDEDLNRYFPKNGIIRQYEEDTLVFEIKYYPNSAQENKIMSIEGDRIVYDYFNRSGGLIKKVYIDKHSKKTISTTLFEEKKNSDGIIEYYKEITDNNLANAIEYWYNKVEKTATYYYNRQTFTLKFFHDTIFSFQNLKNDESDEVLSVSSVFTNSSLHQFIQYKNGNYTKRHYFGKNLFTILNNQYSTVYDIRNFFYYINYRHANEIVYQPIYNYVGFEITDEYDASRQIDSLFDTKGLIGINYYHNDSLIRYQKKGNALIQVYHSKYLHKVKDVLQCAVGLKNLKDEWVVPAKFDEIETIFLDSNLMYVCKVKEYTAIYSWDGKLLLPSTAYIENFYHRAYEDYGYNIYILSDKLRDSLHLTSKYIIKQEDEIAHKYRILTVNDETVFESSEKLYIENLETKELSYLGIYTYDSFGMVSYYSTDGIRIDKKYSSITRINKNLLILKTEISNYFFANADQKKLDFDSFLSFNKLTQDLYILRYTDKTYQIINIKEMRATSKRMYLEFYNINTFNEFNLDKILFVNNGKYIGAINSKLETIIPFKYTQQFIGKSDYHILQYGKLYDFYDNNFRFINSIEADSILFNVFTVLNDFYYEKNTFTNKGFLPILKGKQVGLIHFDGKSLLPSFYDEIYFDLNQNIVIGELNKELHFFHFEAGNGSISNISHLEFEGYLNAESIRNSNKILVDYRGNLVERNVALIDHNIYNIYSTYKKVYLSRNDTILGTINYLGEWLVKNSQYKKTHKISNSSFEYVIDRDNKTGVINCKGHEIIQPKYNYIAFDKENNLYWYNIKPLNRESYYNNDIAQNIWHVKNTQTGKTLNDTLKYPTKLIKGYCLTQNQHQHYGVFDSSVNIKVPFEYISYYVLYHPQVLYILKHKDGHNDIFDSKFDLINTNHFDHISTLFDSALIAYRNNSIYLLRNNFSINDSSTNLFADKPKSILENYGSEVKNLKFKLFNDIQLFEKEPMNETDKYNYLRELESFETTEKDSLLNAYKFNIGALNIMTVFNSIFNQYVNHPFASLEIYPYPTYTALYRYESPFNDFEFKNAIYINNTLFTPLLSYSPSIAKLSDFIEYKYINFIYTFDHVISLNYMPNDKNRERYFTNIFIRDNGALNYINLSDLIPIDNTTVFNRLVIDKLTEIDPDIVPCYENPDFYEILSEKMVLGKTFARFYLNDEVEFDIPYTKLKPLMRPYWTKQLGL